MKRTVLFALLILIVGIAAAFRIKKPAADSVIAFTGATLIDGNGIAPVLNSVLLISKGRIIAAGTRQQVPIPSGAQIIDLHGKTIIPGLINAHGHPGDVKGIEGGHYSLQNVKENLGVYARYGITSVVSLGNDKPESEPVRAVNDTMPQGHARLYIAGEIINGNTPAAAVARVDANHKMGIDWMKIRVEDNFGTSPKMPEEIYTAIIKRSHELGDPIAVHMYYLSDAKKLLQAGADLLAHSIRDKPVDAELIALMKQKKAGYCPTLTRELSTYVYGDTAAFFKDPFFLKEYGKTALKPLLDPAAQLQVRNSINAINYKRQLPIAMANLKKLSDAGIPIAMGTDSGVPTRFMGYFEHLEMEMMAQAGMTPMKILVSATRDAAKCMKLKDLGLLKKGYKADFVILDKNPLLDIRNTRSISTVWISGEKIDRD